MSNNIIPVESIKEMAVNIAKSGLFPDINTPEKAFALMMLCQAEGLHPAMALRKYNIIQNRPAMKADAMLAEFNQRGGKCNWITLTDKEAKAEFIHPNGTKATITWTWEMASKIRHSYDQKAGRWIMLTDKHNWKNYPRQMLRARVISEGIRTVMPEACMGIYTPEEVQDFPEEKVREIVPPKPQETTLTPPKAKEIIQEAETTPEIPQNEAEMPQNSKKEPETTTNYPISTEKPQKKAFMAQKQANTDKSEKLRQEFQSLREFLGDDDFYHILQRYGYKQLKDIKTNIEAKKIIKVMKNILSGGVGIE